MKDSVLLKVNARTLFGVMKQSVIQETGQKNPALSKGLSWKRKSGSHTTKVTLTQWKEPFLYGARFETGKVVLNVAYELQPKGDQEVLVTYTHDLGKDDWLIRRKEKAAVKKAIQLLHKVETALQAK